MMPAAILSLAVGIVMPAAIAQTDCNAGNGDLDSTPPKNITAAEIIQKFGAGENKVRDARSHYTYTQDMLIQTLNDKSAVDGQMHEVTTVSFDDKGKRQEKVTFAEQSTLRGIQLTADDIDDVRRFMPWILTSDQVPEYNLTYSGQMHVDDLDTYVFHVEPKKQEKGKRYFSGRIWVDNRDFQIVKLCGKSVPDQVQPKKHRPLDVRPTFVGYRQLVDGFWFPAYAKVDDTLTFRAESIHLREILKFTGYTRSGQGSAGAKP
jgi:hypothetical protein